MSLTRASFSMITGTPVNVLDFIPQAEHAAILNRTSTYDCQLAILEAINALSAPSDTLYFPNGLYCTSSLTIPIDAFGQAKAMSFAGEGAGGYYFTEIRLLTPSGTLFDFTNATAAYIAFQNLYLAGYAPSGTSSATSGTGIKINSNNTWSRLNNVSFISFDTGLHLQSPCQFYYSSMFDCQFNYNYSYGMKADSGTLLNGVQITGCHFSNTGTFTGDTPNHLGTGAYIVGGHAGLCFSNSTSENNSNIGIYVEQFFSVRFDSCYFELNGFYDIYLYNLTNYQVAQATVDSCYFDPDTNRPIVNRIRSVGGCRLTLINNKFMATNLNNPPVGYDSIYSQSAGYKGLFTLIGLNNEYPTATLTNTGDGECFIVDSKHPLIQYGAASPNKQTVKAGELTFNTNETTLSNTLGWLTTVSGRTGTLPTNTATATTVLGNSNIQVNDTDNTFFPGDVISVAGVTWFNPDTTTTSYTTILYAVDGTNFTTYGAANQSVSGAAITYRAGTVTPLAKIPLDNNLALVPGLEIVDNSTRITKRDAAVTTSSALVLGMQLNGKDTGNHTIVRGFQDSATNKQFTEVVTWFTNGGSPTVSNVNEVNTPAARTYVVIGNNLHLSMGGGTAYTVTALNTMFGY